MRYLRKCGANGIVGRHRCDPKLFCRHAAQLQLRQARIPSWGLPLTDPVEPQLVLDGHRQQKLHSGLVRYCISKAPDIARFVRPDRCARSFGLAWRHPRDAILYNVPFFVSLRLPIVYRKRRSIIRLRMCNHPSGL